MKRMIIIMIVAVFMYSCAARQTVSRPAERIFKDAEIKSDSGVNLPLEEIISLEKRVKAYWDARLADDLFTMYELEDPEVIKAAKLSKMGYANSQSGAVIDRAYEVKMLQILEPEKVRVFILLDAFINIPGVMKEEKAILRDLWLKRDGKWYRKLVTDPFAELPISEREKIVVEPYKGPVKDMPEEGTKIEITPFQKDSQKEPPKEEK